MTRISNKGGSQLLGWQLHRERIYRQPLKGHTLLAIVVSRLFKGLGVSRGWHRSVAG